MSAVSIPSLDLQYIQQRINRDRVWFSASIACASIGVILLVCVRIDFEPIDRLFALQGLFMLAFGGSFAWHLWKQIDYSIKHRDDIDKLVLTAVRRQIESDNPSPDLRTQSVLTHKLVIQETRDDETSTSEILWKEGEQPSREFIQECFAIALSNNWRVTEDKISAKANLKEPPFPDPDWNAKLSIMERVGVLKKADPRSNAVRIWQIKKFNNVDRALEAFGLSPIRMGQPVPPTPTLAYTPVGK